MPSFPETLIFLLTAGGAASFAKSAVPLRRGALFLLLFPFLCYLAISFCHGRFGHHRNFFHLLPLCAILIAACLREVRSRAARLLLILLLASSMLSVWSKVLPKTDRLYSDRAKFKAAARTDIDCFLIEYDRARHYQFAYYQNKLLPFRPVWLLGDEADSVALARCPKLAIVSSGPARPPMAGKLSLGTPYTIEIEDGPVGAARIYEIWVTPAAAAGAP